MKTIISIPPNSGPDSLWRQAERAVEEENAGTPPFAERIARELLLDRLEHPYVGRDTASRWAAIIDRHIRKATGVR